jgi:hypothetical protein
VAVAAVAEATVVAAAAVRRGGGAGAVALAGAASTGVVLLRPHKLCVALAPWPEAAAAMALHSLG